MRDGPLPARLRIALLTHSVNPRGGVVHTLELANALHAAGHTVTVFAPAAPGQALFRPVAHALRLMPVRDTGGDLVTRVAARIDACVAYLADALATETFDVLHAQDSISGQALARLRERGGVDGFVRTVHHLDTFADPRLMAWQQQAFTSADQVLCVSQLWCDALLREHGVAAARVDNGVDRLRYQPHPGPADAALARRLGLRPGAPLCLAVGGIEARKNSRRLLRAFARLHAERPGAQLVIAGGATLLDHGDEVRGFADDLGDTGLAVGPGQPVVLTGTVADAEMPALYRLADVLAMPSLCEGFGLAVLEALASGTPVVVSARAPFTEYLAPEAPGWCWADPEQVDSIAAALARATEPHRASALRAAPPDVLDRFSWAASAARHVALYRARHALAPHPA